MIVACITRRLHDESRIYLVLYVDDILIATQNIKDIRELKSSLNAEFEMKDLGIAWKILEVEIYRDREISKLFLSQKRYIRKILHRFGMQTAKSKDTPMESNIKLGMYTIQTEE